MNTTPTASAPRPRSPHAAALIVATAGMLTTMAIHPTSLHAQAASAEIIRDMQHLVATHVLALACLPLLLLGALGVNQRLGWQRPAAQFAFAAYALGIVAVMFAAIADGLITPALVAQAVAARDALGHAIERTPEMNLNFQLNQACAKVYVAAVSLAIAAWSICLWRGNRFERGTAAWGTLVATVCLLGLFGGHLAMSAHGFGAIVLLQSTWIVAVARVLGTDAQ